MQAPGRRMDLKQLEYFRHVAELGSFTRAAAFLSVVQPALSRQVRQLEVELGQNLFDRNGRGVVLTDAGTRLLEHTRGILTAGRPGPSGTRRPEKRRLRPFRAGVAAEPGTQRHGAAGEGLRAAAAQCQSRHGRRPVCLHARVAERRPGGLRLGLQRTRLPRRRSAALARRPVVSHCTASRRRQGARPANPSRSPSWRIIRSSFRAARTPCACRWKMRWPASIARSGWRTRSNAFPRSSIWFGRATDSRCCP